MRRPLLFLPLPLLLSACPREISKPAGAPAAAATEASAAAPAAPAPPQDPRLKALIEGTALEDATDEERRLALKIAAVDKVRREMRAILEALPAEKKAAEDLDKRLKAVEGKLDKAEVEKALLASKQELLQRLEAGEDNGSLLARARAIDGKLDGLAQVETPAAGDSETVRQLKTELEKQQRATLGMAAATRVAFRALAVIEQMKVALPKLEELAAQKKG